MDGKRYMIESKDLKRTYLYVDNEALFITIANENSLLNVEHRTLLETLCRISSKALKSGVPLEVIREQMIAGDMGGRTILCEMADRIGRYLEDDQKRNA